MIILPSIRGVIRHNPIVTTGLYVGSAGTLGATVPKPVGLAVNDLMAVHACHGDISLSGGDGGWNKQTVVWNNYGYTSTVMWKKVTSNDISATINISGIGTNGITSNAWRGPNSMVLMATAPGSVSASDTTLIITRNAKNIASMGQVSFTADRDPSGTPTPPSGWTTRQQFTGQFFQMTACDRIDGSQPAGAGTDTFSNFTSGFDQTGFNFELRS